jgi:hypothetical protein
MNKRQEERRKRSSKVMFWTLVVFPMVNTLLLRKLDFVKSHDFMITVGVDILICALAFFLFRSYIRDGRKSGERDKPSCAWLTKRSKRWLTRWRNVVFVVFAVDILVMVYITKAGISGPYQSILNYVLYILLPMAFIPIVLLVFGNEKDSKKQDEPRSSLTANEE